MTTHYLQTPLTEAAVRQLRIGDVVYLSGRVFTSRDMAHLRYRQLIESGQALPEDIEPGGVVFHAGPVAIKENDHWKLVVIGPTTSMRMEPHSDLLSNLGVRAIVGKGGMGPLTQKTLKEWGAVYLAAVPGAAVKHSAAVKRIVNVHWLELGMPEAVWLLEVDSWGPLVVGMDSHGASLYDQIAAQAVKIKEKIIAQG